MLIIPAIDLKEGCVVRLLQGDFKNAKVYSNDPLKIAEQWGRQGAKLIHIVDLDAAQSGVIKNLGVLKEILANISVNIQFGGGVRDIQTIKMLLDLGVFRVVLGTKAIMDRDFLKQAFAEFKDKIIVSVDARAGQILIKGWQETHKDTTVLSLAEDLKQLGFKQFIYTDISKDGTLQGPNINGIKALLKNTGLKIIASGGISSVSDIRRLKTLEKEGLEGIIIGKALYEGKVRLKEVVQ